MSLPVRNLNKAFNEIDQNIPKARPCQLSCVAALTTGVALAILGFAIGGTIGNIVLVAGAALGYFAYNSLQFLINLENLRARPITTVGIGVFRSASNLFSGKGPVDITLTTLGKNTLFFDWAIKEFAAELLDNKILPGTMLDNFDQIALGLT